MLHLSKVPVDGIHVRDICCISLIVCNFINVYAYSICCDVFISCLNVRYTTSWVIVAIYKKRTIIKFVSKSIKNTKYRSNFSLEVLTKIQHQNLD